ncbi:LacI family DNA-binding transcriptional regulator [Celeribacter sp.]|uniref:LacI family DNA-binding transcriptional regulator n=1 Tax=Celeribacter sp. TaxID=1890673 RepID=UPI003A926F4D
MAPKTRIKDIARELNIAPATVSRALSSSGLVAEPKLSLIRQKAAEMNYRPNVQARSLRTQRSMSILVAVRDIGNPFYLEVFKGVEAVAREQGYSALMVNTDGKAEREQNCFEMLHDGHADGMILMTGNLPDKKEINTRNIVVALEGIDSEEISQVLIDNAAAVRQAVDHLVGLGHSRIAHIRGPVGEGMSEKRDKGFRAALAAHDIPLREDYQQRGDYNFEAAKVATDTLLDLPEPPTAIFASNDEMAIGVLSTAQERGLRIPQDLSVVGLDDIYLSRAVFPALTTVSQPRADIGQCAMTTLLAQLNGDALCGQQLFPTHLVERATTGAPSNSNMKQEKET